jgi:hypothetical protein
MSENLFTIAISVIVVAMGFLVLWHFLRKVERKNNVLTVTEASLDWNDVKCIKCNQIMNKGYSFAGKGINWMPKDAKKPGAFSTVGSVLENTFSLRIPPVLNMAWYCKSCKVIVVDNSKMLRIRNA